MKKLAVVGNVHCDGAADEDRVDGGKGDDFLYGLDGEDHLIGGPDADTLVGGTGCDLVEGGPGKDTLRIVDRGMATDYDQMAGGKGDDTYEFKGTWGVASLTEHKSEGSKDLIDLSSMNPPTVTFARASTSQAQQDPSTFAHTWEGAHPWRTLTWVPRNAPSARPYLKLRCRAP